MQAADSRWTRRVIRTTGLALILPLAVAAAVYGHWALVDHRLTVVTPSRVFQSAAMNPAALTDVVNERGIQTVIDFREDSDLSPTIRDERAALEQRGVHYVHIPSSTRPAPDTVESFLRVMTTEVANHRVVLLHCHDGEGRAVFYSAIYRMEFEGWDNQKAFQGTTRLPGSLMFLADAFPSLGRLSPRNVKTAMILGYQRQTTTGGKLVASAPD